MLGFGLGFLAATVFWALVIRFNSESGLIKVWRFLYKWGK